MAKLNIDNKIYEVTEGKNLLETCLSLKKDLPYFCWHPAMGSVGACRQCAVKIFKDEKDTHGKLMMSCMETVKDGLRISINDNGAKSFREQVIEWLMTNHPHDCPVCDEGGSCHLQDMTVMTGHDYRRYTFKKRTYRNQYLGPFIHHEMNRCIQCYRCVRYYRDYAGGKDLNVFGAHNHVYFGRAEDGVLQSAFSGNLVEVCPTGVFTDKTLKEHYTRKWDLTSAPSICMNCSLGCNIMGGERYGELRLITNRYHPEVNGYFICDRGRFGYEYVNDENRIHQMIIRNRVPEAVGISELFEHVKNLFASSDKIIGIGSSRASVESNYALQKITGKENFFKGITNIETNLLQHVLQLMHSGSFDLPSQKQIEQADAIIIVGEDLTNSAPMLALAVRQALYKTAVQKDVPGSVPAWNDAAVRNFVQEDKGYLCVLNTYREELSELADEKYYASPKAITSLVKKIIALLKGENIHQDDAKNSEGKFADGIVQQLKKAKNPIIITGISCYNLSLIQAAADLAVILKNEKQKAGICFVVPECNSVGLTMVHASSVQSLIDDPQQVKDNTTLVVMENDLYRRFSHQKLEAFFKRFKHVVVLDSLHNQTTQQATVLIPAATFAEANGTVINHEGRAQAFYKVLVNRPPQIRASWHWLNDLMPVKTIEQEKQMKSHLGILHQLVSELPQFSGIEKPIVTAVSAVNSHLHIPMEPHRYSGRTAMLANISVHEPKPVADEESIFSTTMEGERQLPPSPLTPFYWWPGWNSEQALNHYQREVGGLLNSETGDIKLLNGKFVQSNIEPVAITKQEQQEGAEGLWLYPRYHLFGSDELSVYTKGIADLSPKPYICINTNEASKQNWKNNETIELNIDKRKFELEVKIEDDVADGIALIPYGIKETYGIEYPVKLK